MPFFERPSAEIFYLLEGEDSAPCVTLLNGYSRSSGDFRAFAKLLNENGWRVLRLDNRGSGQSQSAPGFKVSDMVTDVSALWTHLGIEKSHLLGVSYGGVLSMLLGNQHAAQVASLCLVSTTPSSFFLSLDNNLASQEGDALEQNLARYVSPKFAQANPLLFRSLIKEMAKAFQDPVSKERAAQQRKALDRYDFTALLHGIHCPTLILHGEDDGVIAPEAAEVTHRAIRQSQLEIFPGVGHLFLAESPKRFYEAVLSFLSTQR
ncbi:alpha/beta hydrolase [bacterium]|nr:alpha/beta hydrolase [bacterium]